LKARAEGMLGAAGTPSAGDPLRSTDLVTGRQLYLRGSSTDEAEAEKILRQFKAQLA
jgi:hypothetical protein